MSPGCWPVRSRSPPPPRWQAAQELRVFPPGQPVAEYIHYAFAVCSATGPRAPVFLNVQAIQRGTGIPGHLGI